MTTGTGSADRQGGGGRAVAALCLLCWSLALPAAETAQDAADEARAMAGGRVLSVREQQTTEGHYFVVKVLTEGRIREVRIEKDR